MTDMQQQHSSRLALLANVPYDLRIEIIENELRKDFTESEKAAIAEKLKPHFRKETNRGKRTDIKNDKPTSANMLAEVKPMNVDEKIGKILGESDENVRRREIVFKKIDDDTKKQLDSGQKSLNSAYKDTIRKEHESRPVAPLPKGMFNHIVEDPGWDFANKNIGGSGSSGASHKYKTQPTVDIARIPVMDVAADDAILYMWTTNQHLITGSMLQRDFLQIAHGYTPQQTEFLGNQKVQSDAISVMHCHGFIPKHIITWEKQNKEGWGGYSFNNVTEHLLIGTRGTVKPFGLSEKTIIKTQYQRKSHSVKPEEMWHLIEKIVKTQRWKHKRLELNCRTPRHGWHPHGDQITQKDIDAWKKSPSSASRSA